MFLAMKKFLMRNFVRYLADFTLFFFRGFSGDWKGARSLARRAERSPYLGRLMGCIAPGRVGTGLYAILLLAIFSVFIAGLLVGRTPENLRKKVEAHETRLSAWRFNCASNSFLIRRGQIWAAAPCLRKVKPD